MRYFISVSYFTHILLRFISSSFSSSSPYSLVILYLKLHLYIFFPLNKVLCYSMVITLCGIITATISKTITTTIITTTTTTTTTTITTITTALYFSYVLSFFFFLLHLLLHLFLLLLLLLLIFSQFHNSTDIIYLSLLLLHKFSSLAYMYHVFLIFYFVLHFPTFCAYTRASQ